MRHFPLFPVIRVAASMVLALPLLGAAGPAAPAGLVFAETTARLPAQWSDTELVTVFKFKNTGAEKITIAEIESSCGCTVPTLDKKDYAPGESGALRVVYTIGGQIGFQRKTLTLKTDSQTQPRILLALETTIPAPLDLQPQLVYWRTGEEPLPKTIRITLPPDLATAQLAATPQSDTFKAELKPVPATAAPALPTGTTPTVTGTPASVTPASAQTPADPSQAPVTYELTLTPAATDKITRVEIPLTLTLPDGRKITRTAYAMIR